MASFCKSCNQPIQWARIEQTGKGVPLDPEVDPNGKLLLVELVPGGEWKVRFLHRGEDPGNVATYRAHHATCPDAETWRKKRDAS